MLGLRRAGGDWNGGGRQIGRPYSDERRLRRALTRSTCLPPCRLRCARLAYAACTAADFAAYRACWRQRQLRCVGSFAVWRYISLLPCPAPAAGRSLPDKLVLFLPSVAKRASSCLQPRATAWRGLLSPPPCLPCGAFMLMPIIATMPGQDAVCLPFRDVVERAVCLATLPLLRANIVLRTDGAGHLVTFDAGRAGALGASPGRWLRWYRRTPDASTVPHVACAAHYALLPRSRFFAHVILAASAPVTRRCDGEGGRTMNLCVCGVHHRYTLSIMVV
jgi:hypothetical protein